MGKYSCEACKKKCKKEAIRLQDKYFHVNCFSCKECKKPLAMDGFYTKDDGHYCADDYRSLFGTKCNACGSLAEGEVVTVLGKTYHQQCFHCNKCGQKFEPGDKVTFVKNEPWCHPCLDGHPPVSPVNDGLNGAPEEKLATKNLTVNSAPPPVTSTPARPLQKADYTDSIASPIDSPSYPGTEKSLGGGDVCNGGSTINKSTDLSSSDQSRDTSLNKSTKSVSSAFGTPNNKFYNISYLERASDYMRGTTTTITPKEQPPRHYHRPDNFSYKDCKRDFMKPSSRQEAGDKNDLLHSSRRPDGQSEVYLAPIERDDWPGPPEPAAAYPELLREKPYRKKSEALDGNDGVVDDNKKEKSTDCDSA